MAKISAIIALGNPGAKYSDTRHNAGQWFVQKLANTAFTSSTKIFATVAEFIYLEHRVRLFYPNTYMNDSGKAVRSIIDYFGVQLESLLIVHDELDLAEGQCRYKNGGGLGGHNGLRSIEQHLHSRDFLRLRIGIGHPGHKSQVTPYVLSAATQSQRKMIDEGIDNAIASIPACCSGDLELAMRQLH